jgi:hypothetical protein
MDVKSTKDQMDSFGFPTVDEQMNNYFAKNGILMKYLKIMGEMFATSENPMLKDYSKVVNTSFLPGN